MSDIKLPNVRVSYPHLFTPKAFQGQGIAKYSAAFLLHKKDHAELIKSIAAAMVEMAKENFKDKRLPPPDKLCLRDGDQSGKADYAGYWVLTATEAKRPVVIDKDKSALAAEDDVIYPGCHVNGYVRLWAQDNQYGKRINANLLGVQFAGPGDPLSQGASTPAVDDMFGDASDFAEADPFAA